MPTYSEQLEKYAGALLELGGSYRARLNARLRTAGIPTELDDDNTDLILSGKMAVTRRAAEIIADHIGGELAASTGTPSRKRDEFLTAAEQEAGIASRRGAPIFGIGASTAPPVDPDYAARAATIRARSIAEKSRLAAGADDDADDTLPEDHVEGDAAEQTGQGTSVAADQRLPSNPQTWRLRNPAGREDKLSFAEVLDESFSRGHTFGQFFQALVKEWDIQTPTSFVESTNRFLKGEKGLGQKIAWHWMRDPDNHKPEAVVTGKLVRAYDLDAAHEQKLWKMVQGKALPLAEVAATVAEIKEIKEPDENKAAAATLLRKMVDATGMSDERLEQFAGATDGSLDRWKKDRVNRINVARSLADIVTTHLELPPGTLPEEVEGLRHELVQTFTGKDTSKTLFSVMMDALDSENPPAAMIRYISENEHKRKEITRLTGMTIRQLDLVTAGARKFRESEAEKLMDLIPYESDEEYRDIMAILTGQEDAEHLLEQAVSGHITVREVLQHTMLRRDHALRHVQPVSIGSASLDSMTVSHFLDPEGPWISNFNTSRNIASYLGFDGDRARQFAILAAGLELEDPIAIVDRVEAGGLSRKEALYTLSKQAARTVPDLAEQCGTTYRKLAHCIANGIINEENAETRFAKQVGLRGPDARKFRTLFGQSLPEAVVKQTELGWIEPRDALISLLRMTGKDRKELREALHVTNETLLTHNLMVSPQLPEVLDSLAELVHAKGLQRRLHLLFDPACAAEPDSYESRRRKAILGEITGSIVHHAQQSGAGAGTGTDTPGETPSR